MHSIKKWNLIFTQFSDTHHMLMGSSESGLQEGVDEDEDIDIDTSLEEDNMNMNMKAKSSVLTSNCIPACERVDYYLA
jgi:hypothetical protein